MNSTKIKLIRTSTIALSLDVLLKGQLKYLKSKYDVIAISGYDQHLEIVREREGVKIQDVAMERNIAPVQDLKSLIQLYKVLKAEKPTIVHSITPKAGLLTMLAAKFAGVPVRIHTFTGLVFPTRSGKMQQLLIKMDQLLCWAATHIIPEGEGVKKDLINFNITNKPLRILANGNVNGIDLDLFHMKHFSPKQLDNLRVQIGLDPNKKTLVFVGRLVKDKGINELITAFKLLDQSKVQLLLVGPYEDKDPILSEHKAHISSAPNVYAVGFQSDVRPYFAISDLLVFPSYREGFPNVVIQAGAMGLPAIVTDISGSNEIIIKDENGIIIPSKNSDALYESMEYLISNPDKLNQLKSNARRLVESRYDQHIVWEAVNSFYKEALKQKELV